MNEQPSTFRVALKWGLILGLALTVYSLILYLTDNVGETLPSLIIYPIVIVGLIVGMRDFRTQNNGFMSYGQGLTVGVITGAISGLLYSIFNYFYTTFIDPAATERALDKLRDKYEEMGLSEEQIDSSMEMMQNMQNPLWTMAVGIFSNIILALILSLIVAAFLRNEKKDPFE
jgi:Na+/H+-dicarboxylate symporter